MRDEPVSKIIRAVHMLRPQDTVGRAAEALRVSGLSELPVVNVGRVVGMVGEASVLAALTAQEPAAAVEQPIDAIASEPAAWANRFMSIGQVAEIMKDHALQVLPVMDENGIYLGVVTRSDVASAIRLAMRPPMVAGLATPLGVYLTTGNLRAGVRDLGLLLAGVALMLLNYAAVGIILGLAWLLGKASGYPLWAIMNSPPIAVLNWMDAVRTILLGAGVPIFLLLLRMLPLSGYHAAEHQVVHAIEQGEPLKPANVREMPRVHPRCGTNLMAGAILFLMVAEYVSAEIAVLVTMFVLIFGWRIIGGYLQYYVTTKPANLRQIESGIRAGESLLQKYRENPAYRATEWARIWNTGMPQVLIGAAATMLIGRVLNLPLPGGF